MAAQGTSFAIPGFQKKKENPNMAQAAMENIRNQASGQLSGMMQKNQNLEEGELTKRIEEQTAKVPSVGFLGLAIGSMALSAGLAIFSERKEFANFVGLWAPSFLLLGIYNKIVKLQGSDMNYQPQRANR
jgi:hypothetical protein